MTAVSSIACIGAADPRHLCALHRLTASVRQYPDSSDSGEVIWAVSTRCDPKSAITIVDGCWSALLDSVISPARREAGELVSSRAILNACRP